MIGIERPIINPTSDTLLKQNTVITDAGFSLLGQVFTGNDGTVYNIAGAEYAMTTEAEIEIPLASEGMQYFYVIALNEYNTMQLVAGPESADNPAVPTLGPGLIEYTTGLADDAQVYTPATPVSGDEFVNRGERALTTYNMASGGYDGEGQPNLWAIYAPNKSSNFLLTGTSLGYYYVSCPNNTHAYDGKLWFFRNGQATDQILKHVAEGQNFGYLFSFPDEQDYILKPGETAQFVMKITGNNKGVLQFVGNIAEEVTIVTTVKTITSAALTTQDAAGFVAYINALGAPLVVAANETVEYQLSDTGRVFKLLLRGRSFGTGQPAITTADVEDATLWMNKDLKLSNYPSSRNDGTLPTNKILCPDTNGNLKLYSMATMPAPYIDELIPDSYLPSTTGNIRILGSYFTPAMCDRVNNPTAIVLGGVTTIHYATFVSDNEILVNVTTGSVEGVYSCTLNNGLSTTKTNALLIVLGTVYKPLTAEWINVSNAVPDNDKVQLSSLNIQCNAEWTREFDYTIDWSLRFNMCLSPLGPASGDRNQYNKERLILKTVDNTSTIFKYQLYQQTAGPGNMSHNAYTLADGWADSNVVGGIGLDGDVGAWDKLKNISQYELRYVGGVLKEMVGGAVVKTHTDVLTQNLKLIVKVRSYEIENIKYIELA